MAQWLNEEKGHWEHDWDERIVGLMRTAIIAASASDAEEPDAVDTYVATGQLEVTTLSDNREYVVYNGIEYSNGCDVAVDIETGKVIVDPDKLYELLFSDPGDDEEDDEDEEDD